VNTPGVVGYADPGTTYRGNLTQVKRYKGSADNSPSISEFRRYDMTGNLVEDWGPCCVDTKFTYTAATQFAYPEQITRGETGSTAPVSQSVTYDLSTGLPLTSTDANGLRSTRSYYEASLRLRTQTVPTDLTRLPPWSGYAEYQYDDAAMSVTQSSYIPRQGLCVPMPCQPILEAQSITQFNGLGLVQRVQNKGDGDTWNAVSRQYDALGRLWQVSEPYRLPQGPVSWATRTYDSLNRVTSVSGPDGSPVVRCFDETARPSSASPPLPGQTVRIIRNIPNTSSFNCSSPHSVAPNSRETWQRTNALGQLAEVVEPAADGGGSVFDPGNVHTVYSYNGVDLPTLILQGTDQQERDFQYDLLGRLTAQYLPEKSRTLDVHGLYLGPEGRWSDVFEYNDRSNLVSHVDARGVKTVYDFDALNRLQSVYYPSVARVDSSSPILPSPDASYSYMPTGDVTRLQGIKLAGTNGAVTEQYDYDPPGLLHKKTLSFPGQEPLVLTYNYDLLYRLTEQIYPVEYGTPSQAQKTVDYTPGMGGFLDDLKVNGADYASQITYNPAGAATSITVGPAGAQQTTETYNYDPATGLLTWQNVRRGSSIPPLLTLCYGYYPSHQLRWLQTLLQCNETLGTNKDTLSYDYDGLGRLHDVKATGAFGEATWSETYAYDSYGNRLSVTASGKDPDGSPIPLDGLAGSPTPPNGLVALTYDLKNHITTPPGFAPPGFAYDAAGNQIRTLRADGSWVRYQYDQAGRLAQVTDDSGKLLEQYAYGADGRRLKKTNSGGSTYYFWDGSHVIGEYAQPPALPKWTWSKSHIYSGDRILATLVPETSEGQFSERAYYHHPDRLGVRLITNSADSTATEQVTLPFGTLIPSPAVDPINPMFTSYDRSSITGLDYAINRHYRSLERFTQVDPAEIAAVNPSAPQSLNMYSYTRNDPINNLDPSGLDDTESCTDNDDGTTTCNGKTTMSENVTVVAPPTPPPLIQAPDDETPGFLPGQFTPPTANAPGGGVLIAGVGGGSAGDGGGVANKTPPLLDQLRNAKTCQEYKNMFASAYSGAVEQNKPVIKQGLQIYGGSIVGGVAIGVGSDVLGLVYRAPIETGLAGYDAAATAGYGYAKGFVGVGLGLVGGALALHSDLLGSSAVGFHQMLPTSVAFPLTFNSQSTRQPHANSRWCSVVTMCSGRRHADVRAARRSPRRMRAGRAAFEMANHPVRIRDEAGGALRQRTVCECWFRRDANASGARRNDPGLTIRAGAVREQRAAANAKPEMGRRRPGTAR